MPDAALDHEAGAVLLAPGELEARDLDLALGQLDLLPRAGERVGAAAADLDRRVGVRALAQDPGRQRQRLGRHAPGRELALAVAGGRGPAQARDRLVALGQRHQEALDARRAAHEHEQQPGRERVQRARVADLDALAEPAPDPRDDVVRGDPRRLVEDDDPVVRAQSCSARLARRTSTSCG